MNLNIFTHFYNEELLLPAWLNHHYPLADRLILVNDNSTDKSVEVIQDFIKKIRKPGSSVCKEVAILNSKREWFGASALDAEMMEIEKLFPADWKLILNTTEFLWTPNLKQWLHTYHTKYPQVQALGLRSFIEVGKEHWGFADASQSIRRNRWAHNQDHGHYQLGRHGVNLVHAPVGHFWIKWLGYSPWPECKQRKLQIQTRIPESDKAAKLGFEHIITEQDLEIKYQEMLAKSYDLTGISEYNKML